MSAVVVPSKSRTVCVYIRVVHFFDYTQLSTSTPDTKYLVPTQVDPQKKLGPIITKKEALDTPKVYVVAACLFSTPLHNKKYQKRAFLCILSKRVTSTTPLNIALGIGIIECFGKIGLFLLNKLKSRPIFPPLQYIQLLHKLWACLGLLFY